MCVCGGGGGVNGNKRRHRLEKGYWDMCICQKLRNSDEYDTYYEYDVTNIYI